MIIKRQRTAIALLFSLASLCMASFADAEWFADAELGTVYEDNLSRAFNKSDRESDIAFEPHATVGQHLQLSDPLGLSVTAHLKDSVYGKYYGLNNLAIGVMLSLKYKMGLGSYAPWVKVYGSATYLDYNETDRSGSLWITGFTIGKRINERAGIMADFDYESRKARNSVFNQSGNKVSLKADYLLTDIMMLSFGYAISRNDIAVSYALLPYSAYSAGDIIYTFNTPMEVERVRATIQTLSADANLAINGNLSVNLGIKHHDISADNHSYPDNIVSISINYSY